VYGAPGGDHAVATSPAWSATTAGSVSNTIAR
jgi:hypothetical protein